MDTYAAHYNFDFGLVVRYLGGEYTAVWKIMQAIVGAVEDLISSTYLEQMKRVLARGALATFSWEEPTTNRKVCMRRGNNLSIKHNEETVQKTMNKEESRSHIIPFPCSLLEASPFGRHTLQPIIPGKVDHLNPENTKKSRLC